MIDHVADHMFRSRDPSSEMFGDFETLLGILKHLDIRCSGHVTHPVECLGIGDFETLLGILKHLLN